MDHADVYRLRVEDYARRWENHRRFELEVNIQVYAGFAAIAVAYWHLRHEHQCSSALGWATVVAIVMLYAVTTYLACRTQERLHFNAGMMDAYLTKLHGVFRADQLPRPLGVRQPQHQRWYGFGAQTILTYGMAIALLVYESATTPPVTSIWHLLAICGVLALALSIYVKRALVFRPTMGPQLRLRRVPRQVWRFLFSSD